MRRILLAVFAGIVLAVFASGCGMFKGSESDGDGFAWEYLFDDDGSGSASGSAQAAGANSQEGNATEDVRRSSAAYRLQFDDAVAVTLLGVREFQNSIESRVDENGEISMPYIDNVQAEGKTSSELASHIKKLYIDNGIYKNLNVKVIIPSQSAYYIRGEVKRPGSYPWKSGLTLSQAISSAAGITEYASNKIILTRQGEVVEYDLREIENDPSKDIVLRPDDQIRIGRSIF